jgi:hypothetical protein
MSRGGFKAFCVTVTGNSRGGDATSAIKSVLTPLTNFLTKEDNAIGWSYDSKTPNASSYITVGGGAGLAQFLVHSTGAKLMIAMCASSKSTNPFNYNSYFNPKNGNASIEGVMSGGLCMAMIPPGGGNFNTDKITDTSFLPQTALRIVGNGVSNSSSYYPQCFVERSDMARKQFRYMIVAKDDIIMVASRLVDYTDRCSFYAIGNLINCAQDGDTNSYAAFVPHSSFGLSGLSEGDYDLYSFISTGTSDDAINPTGCGNCQIYAADGGLLAGGSTYTSSETTAKNATALIERHVGLEKSFGSSSRRFVSFAVGMEPTTSDKSCGVVAYEGYKGVINPEIMCQIYHPGSTGLSNGTLLDDGNYMHLCNGVVIGWDSSNAYVKFWD